MLDDSIKAISLNDKYFKAYLRAGEAYVELGKHPRHKDTNLNEKGINNLKKALYFVWKLTENDPNFAKKDTFYKEIGK